MLKYSGKFNFDKPLNEKELEFLNSWQNELVRIFEKNRNFHDKALIAQNYKEMNYYSGIDFNELQAWALSYAMSPMIKFHKNYMEVEGISPKGNVREAVMAYHHFFLGPDAVLKECMDLKFMEPHKLNGIIECYKKDLKGNQSRWCYKVTDDQFESISAPSLQEYYHNPGKWQVIVKPDSFYDEKLLRYFPPLMQYASIKKSLDQKVKDEPTTTKVKKLKI